MSGSGSGGDGRRREVSLSGKVLASDSGLHTWKGGCAWTIHMCLISSPQPR